MNQLIEMVATQKPLPPDPSDDLMFREPPRRMPSGTGVPVNPRSLGGPTLMGPAGPSNLPPVVQPVSPPPQNQTLMGIGLSPEELIKTTKMSGPPEAMQALPMSSPIISGSIDPREIPPPELPPGAFTTQPHVMPVAAPFGEMPAHAPWLEQPRAPSINEQFTNTQRLKRANDWKRLAGKLIAPMIGLVILGIFVGGYFAFDGEGGKPRTPKAAAAKKKEITVIPQPSATPAATPAPAPAPAATPDSPTPAPAPTPTPTPTPEPVATTSAPAPATEPAPAPAPAAAAAGVVAGQPALVDVRIDSKPAGATVMLVDRGKTTFLGTTPISTSLDPAREYDLVFTASGLPTRLEHLDARATKHVQVNLTKRRSSSTTPAPTATASGSGTGTLMISTKPPCEIIVDGKPTGLVTPQRAITLPVGTHKVTLVNSGENIKKTIAVEITADQATRVIQDLMQ